MNLYYAELHIPSDRAKHGIPCTNFKTDNTATSIFSVFFYVFSFYSTGMICCNMQNMKCDLWKEQNDYSLISLKDPSCVFGITGKYIDFSNIIKLFRQRDNIVVS